MFICFGTPARTRNPFSGKIRTIILQSPKKTCTNSSKINLYDTSSLVFSAGNFKTS